jgi:hypothetical protein
MPDLSIKGRQAEFTAVRTASGGFYIHGTVGQISIGIIVIGKVDSI